MKCRGYRRVLLNLYYVRYNLNAHLSVVCSIFDMNERLPLKRTASFLSVVKRLRMHVRSWLETVSGNHANKSICRPHSLQALTDKYNTVCREDVFTSEMQVARTCQNKGTHDFAGLDLRLFS